MTNQVIFSTSVPSNKVTIEDCDSDDDFFNQVTSDFEKKTEEKIQLSKEESKTTFKPNIPQETQEEIMMRMMKGDFDDQDLNVMLKKELEFKIKLYKEDFNTYKKQEIEQVKMMQFEALNVESSLKLVFNHFGIEIKNASNKALLALCSIAMTGVMAHNESLFKVYYEKINERPDSIPDENPNMISSMQEAMSNIHSEMLNIQIATVTSLEDKRVYNELFMKHLDNVVKEFEQDSEVQNLELEIRNLCLQLVEFFNNASPKDLEAFKKGKTRLISHFCLEKNLETAKDFQFFCAIEITNRDFLIKHPELSLKFFERLNEFKEGIDSITSFYIDPKNKEEFKTIFMEIFAMTTKVSEHMNSEELFQSFNGLKVEDVD